MRKNIGYFLFVFVLLGLSSVLQAQNLLSKDYTVDDPLEMSISLLLDTISLIENIQSDNKLLKTNNESLEAALMNVSDMLKLQGQLLNEQAKTQTEQLAISMRQSYLLNRELRNGKLLKMSLIISVPACIGLGMLIGNLIFN